MTEPTTDATIVDLDQATRAMALERLEELKKRIRCAPFPPKEYAGLMTIPKRYRDKRLIDLDKRYTGKIKAALRATRAGHNVLIYGGIGSGKTHLAVCLLWERWKVLAEVGFDIWREPAILNSPELQLRFRSTADIIAELKAAKAQWRREDELVDQAVQPAVLLIDDIGFEERSENVRTWLSTILDRRYRSMRQTILTTNLTPEDLSDAIDDRVTSRIIETGIIVHLDGGDFRKILAEENRAKIYTAEET